LQRESLEFSRPAEEYERLQGAKIGEMIQGRPFGIGSRDGEQGQIRVSRQDFEPQVMPQQVASVDAAEAALSRGAGERLEMVAGIGQVTVGHPHGQGSTECGTARDVKTAMVCAGGRASEVEGERAVACST